MWISNDIVLSEFIQVGDVIYHDGLFVQIRSVTFGEDEWMKLTGIEQEWEESVEFSIKENEVKELFIWE